MLHWVWKLLLLGALTYVALIIYLYVMQPKMLFYPDMPGRRLTSTPGNIGLAYQDVELTTDDQVRLHGWYVPASKPRGVVLFFHGNAGNISHRLDSIRIFHDLDMDVLIIDYRGYGQSGGKITERGTYEDAEAAWRYLVEMRNIRAERIVIFGRSLGGSVAAWLASQHRPAALILESAFRSVPAMGKRFYPWLPVRLLSRYKYDTERYVRNVSGPVLVAHSRDDEIIPYEEGEKIYAAISGSREFLEMRGGHNDGFMVSSPAYERAIKSFIYKQLRRASDME